MVMGDTDTQEKGNIKAEKAEWKSAVMGHNELPSVSSERVDAKVKR